MILAMLAVLGAAIGICLMIQAALYAKRYDKAGTHGYFDDPAVWFLAGFALLVMCAAYLL